MQAHPPKRLYLGIAAAAGAVLALEIGLTRLFSYTIWYHFAYLSISVALLGYGAAGSALAAFPALGRASALAWWAVAAEAGVVVALVVIRAVPLDPLALGSDPGQVLRLLAYYVAVTIPFLCGGFLVAAPLQLFPRAVGRLYFWDLLGAGLVCAAIVPLIWWVETPVATACATLALAAAALAYAEPGRRLAPGLAAAGAAAAAVVVAGAGDFRPAPTKFVSRFLASPAARLAYHRWTPINRVDVVAFEPPMRIGSYIGWGISPHYRGPAPGYWMIGNDGDSCAVMYEWKGDFADLDFLRHHVLHAPYLLLERPSVLAIGLGGGADVLNALENGARSVTGVEINPMTVHAGRELFREFNGDLLHQPGVEAVVAEGRSFLRSRGARYDLIEINSVDTLSALSTGAYVLSESFLYTSDAVRDYLDHLEPGGIFAMAVGDLQSEEQPPRHTLRLAGIVRRALEERGVAEPWRHVMIVGTGGGLPFTHTLVRNEPFTPDEVARMAAFLEAEGFEFWHRPDRPEATQASRILTWDRPTLERFYALHPLDLEPTSDASPFFFNFYKWRTLARAFTSEELGYDRTLATGQIVLVVMLLQSVVFAALLILLPLRRVPLASGGSAAARAAYLAYFAALGMGFILLEISMIQRFVLFLGYPTYSLTVVMLSLLVSTGLGSLATERVRGSVAAALPVRLAALLLLGAVWLLAAPRIFAALLGAPFPARVAVSVALLVPLGLVLGSFFPLGIRLASRANAQLVPWAWAVNGCATVIGTLVAVMAGMTWSFTAVTLGALAVYTAGVTALWAAERRAPAPG
jgi:SAM-dependent methyltransferase